MKSKKSFLKKDNFSLNVFLTVLPVFFVVIVTVIMFFYMFSKTKADCINRLRGQSAFTSSRIEGIIESYDGTMNNLSHNSVSQDLKSETLTKQIQSMRINVIGSPIRLFLKDGYAVTEDTVFDDVSKFVQFDKIVSNKPYIDLVENDVFHPTRKCQNYYFPAIKDNEIVGMFSCVVYLEDLLKYTIESTSESNMYVLLVDRRDGSVIVDTDHRKFSNIYDYLDRKINGDRSFQEVIDAINAKESMFFSLKSQQTGKNKYMYTIPSKLDNMSVIIEMEDKVVFKNLYMIRNAFIVFSVFVIMVFCIYLYLL